jgi:glycerol-3-phosphate acyltransferase PlsY
MRLFLAMFIAYLVGSIPTGYLFAKYRNVDLHNTGSGSTGATNVLRSVGKLAALLTLVIDVLKGYIVVALLADIFYNFRMSITPVQLEAVMALCVVAGHNWPLFLSFKGGKGVATSAGVLLALCPKLLIIGLAVWIIIFVFTRIVSIASIISAAAIPIASYCFTYGNTIRFLTIILAILTIVRHTKNIKRLVKKEEKTILVKI